MMKRFLDLFFEPSDLVELRAIERAADGEKKGKIRAGYFKDHEKLVQAAKELDNDPKIKGVYVIVNPIKDGLSSRCTDSITFSPAKSGDLTENSDISRRRWLLLDFDPIRPDHDSGSTDEEHELAITKAKDVRDILTGMGWPEYPILADSGNGAHLIYKIDLPNDVDSRKLVEGCLKAVKKLVGDDKVEVDLKVGNAARIWKLYGTTAKKGANTAERPWRTSKLIDVPSSLEPVEEKLLKSLVVTKPNKNDFTTNKELEKWFDDRYGIVGKKEVTGGQLFKLGMCPFSDKHTDGAFAIRWDDGHVFVHCHHNSCADKSWKDLFSDDQPGVIDEEASPEIHAKAMEILQKGDPIQYIVDSCGRMVIEAEPAFRKLCCCAAVQLVRQSAGLHPKMNGESGSGKTYTVLTFAHHLPRSAVVEGSSSNMAVFYHPKGYWVFRILDDYSEGNETLDTIIKRTSSVFHRDTSMIP